VKSEKVQSESDSGSEPRLPASPSLITSQFQSGWFRFRSFHVVYIQHVALKGLALFFIK